MRPAVSSGASGASDLDLGQVPFDITIIFEGAVFDRRSFERPPVHEQTAGTHAGRCNRSKVVDVDRIDVTFGYSTLQNDQRAVANAQQSVSMPAAQSKTAALEGEFTREVGPVLEDVTNVFGGVVNHQTPALDLPGAALRSRKPNLG